MPGVVAETDCKNIPIQPLTQIHPAGCPKALHQFPGVRVDRIQEHARGKENPPISAFRPKGDAAIHSASAFPVRRIKNPALAASRSVQGEKLQAGRGEIDNPVDHDRITLNGRRGLLRHVVGAVRPSRREFANIAPVDLIERRIFVPAGSPPYACQLQLAPRSAASTAIRAPNRRTATGAAAKRKPRRGNAPGAERAIDSWINGRFGRGSAAAPAAERTSVARRCI